MALQLSTPTHATASRRTVPAAAVVCVVLGLLVVALVLMVPMAAAAAPVRPVWPADIGASDQQVHEVAAQDDYFEPQVITVTVGATVRWTNQGNNIHTTTSDANHWNWTLVPGAQFSVRFLVPGTYPYHCIYHRAAGMTGTVVVTTTAQATPTATSTALPGPTAVPGVPGPGSIVYDYFPPGGNMTDLFVIQPDGTGKQQLTNTPNLGEAQPSWAPELGRVAFSAGAGQPLQTPWRVHVLNVVTGQSQAITAGPYDFEPDWRPDGSQVAFTRMRFAAGTQLGSSISVVAPDGGAVRDLIRLDSTTYILANADWAPDGGRIVFSLRSSAAGGELYTMNADGTNARSLLTRAGWDDIDPVWSPDGRYVSYASGAVPDRRSADASVHDIWVLDVTTGATGTVAQVPDWDLRRPAWSPDGQHIVFNAKYAENAWALYIVPATGGAVSGPLDVGVEPDWGSGSLVPVPTLTPTPITTAPPVTPTTLPFPTFPPPGPTPTEGPPPTFPPATATLEPTPTQVPTDTPPPPTATPTDTPVVGGHGTIYLPYVAQNHLLGVEPEPVCLAEEIEPNNTVPQADALDPVCPGRTVPGTLPEGDEVDLFRVEVGTDGMLKAFLIQVALPDGSNYDLALFKAGELDPVAESTLPGKEMERIEVDVSPGTYYLRVKPAGGSVQSDARYQLTLDN